MNEIEELKSHSNMLGLIASLVENWCDHEECTTYEGVKNLVRAHLNLRVQYHRLALRQAKRDVNDFNES